MLIKYSKSCNYMQEDCIAAEIKRRAIELAALKKELYRRTGSTQPKTKEWPL